ncbi:hypothetical protein [Acidovorax sp. sic0104]|uniref:hypothetical protein n=1 Tax=Acidovorax sp. sic0104 TaxID=2854784 RepID=UPI001C43B96B|nr:hypothetical protein [Acidovorax sp. sic0104]MBV7543062.1 hypothetical protein [Acidovorax sp. sic0104]
MKADRFTTTRLVNAWGTPTLYGVSRSSTAVAKAAAAALQTHFNMAELQECVAAEVRSLSNTPAASFCHCSAAGILISVAAALTNGRTELARDLPRVHEDGVTVINVEHCVDYGHSILQAVRTTGSLVEILTGTREQRLSKLAELGRAGVLKAALWVESLLAQTPPPLDRNEFATAAHHFNAWLIVDAAAKDWKLADPAFLKSMDLAIFSAQKYLAAPTCGIVVGTKLAIAAFNSNLKCIGRPMKPTKDALMGVLAAIRERDWHALDAEREGNRGRAERFTQRLLRDVVADVLVESGTEHGPYPRIALHLGSSALATELFETLLALPEPIVLNPARKASGVLDIELTHVDDEEEVHLIEQLARALRAQRDRTTAEE